MVGMAILLGLAVALTYGAGDFFGGLTTKRNDVLTVVAVSQAASLVILATGFALFRPDLPAAGDVALGSVAGCIGIVGLTLLYRGLAAGRMGIVAPVTAVGAAVVPLAWGLAQGERPSGLALLGCGVALVAVALIARGPGGEVAGGSPAVELVAALAAGTCFGVVFILFSETADDSGLWPLLGGRAAQTVLMGTALAATGRRVRLAPGSWRTAVGAGVFDVGANALYLVGVRTGLVSLVAVLSSLYPASTVVLARFVLGERLGRVQLGGLGLALAGVGLIAGG